MTLDHRHRLVIERPYRQQADGRDLVRESIGPNNEYPRSSGELTRQQSGSGLGAGHNIVGIGNETQFAQMSGDILRRTRSVIGDEEFVRLDSLKRADRAHRRRMPAEEGTVEIQQ